ncbi:MAG TPA: hypothetical protein VML54_00070 [Candidatus Limnocylindrales bacterium]|nr:hypothetical protein [Candidatus Limnocylindrales bacterium]
MRPPPAAGWLIGSSRTWKERMTAAFSRQLAEIQSLDEQLRRLEAMADRQYVSLMLYLPDVPPEDAEGRAADAKQRYQAWRRAVDKLVDAANSARSAAVPVPW